MKIRMEALTFSYGIFLLLVLASGITAKLCKEEYVEKNGSGTPGFWILKAENFTDKGKRLRKAFFVFSNLCLVLFFIILILQEMKL